MKIRPISFALIFAILFQSVFANAAPGALPANAAPQRDIYQDRRVLVQDLTGQQAVMLINQQNLANGRQRQLLADNATISQQLRASNAELERTRTALERASTRNQAEITRVRNELRTTSTRLAAAIQVRESLAREVLATNQEALAQINSYESAIKKVALSDDPNIIAYLERFAIGDAAAVDEFVSYARAQFEIRQRLNNIQFAEQLRVAANQKASQMRDGQISVRDVIPLYREAFDIDKSDLWGGVHLARLYEQIADWGKAKEVYDLLLPNATDSKDRNIVIQGLGDVLSKSDPIAARRYFEESLTLSREALAKAPDDYQAKLYLASSLGSLGNFLFHTDPIAAMLKYREALGIYSALIQGDDIRHDVIEGAFTAATNFAMLAKKDSPDNALQIIDFSLVVAREMVKLYPSEIDPKRDLSFALAIRGDILKISDPAAAETAYQESLQIGRQVISLDPAHQRSRENLSLVLERVAQYKLEAEPAASLILLQEAIALSREILRADNNDHRAKERLANYLQICATINESAQSQTAKAQYEESIALHKELIATGFGGIDLKKDLLNVLNKAGEFAGKSTNGQTAANAAIYYDPALVLAREIYAARPSVNSAQLDLLAALDRSATAAKASAPDRATSLFVEAINLGKQMATAHPEDARHQSNYLFVLMHFATHQNTRANWQAAKTQADEMKTKNLFTPANDANYQKIINALNAAPN